MLPEEFPVVMIIFLTLGAWRLSRRKVLTRNTAAIETLGSTQVLCVDKTGTITINQMKLDTLAVNGASVNASDYENRQNILPEPYHQLMEYAILASQQDPILIRSKKR